MCIFLKSFHVGDTQLWATAHASPYRMQRISEEDKKTAEEWKAPAMKYRCLIGPACILCLFRYIAGPCKAVWPAYINTSSVLTGSRGEAGCQGKTEGNKITLDLFLQIGNSMLTPD